MSTFSSVVRKPGQRIIPKTAPRRNIQRNNARHAAPPSLTPESQIASPIVEPVDDSSQNHDADAAETALESTEIPSTSQTVKSSLLLPTPLETVARTSSGVYTTGIPSVSVEVTVPSSTSQGASIIHNPSSNVNHDRPNTIPTVITSSSSSTIRRQRLTNEPTPAPSEDSTWETEIGTTATSQPSADSSKRRKITHAVPSLTQSRSHTTPPPSENTPLILRSSSRSRRSESRTSDALIQDATTQAAAVSELANSIESGARSLRPRSARPSASQATAIDNESEEVTERAQPKQLKKKQQRSRAIKDIARQVIEDAVGGSGSGGRRRSRFSTPENAEELEIDPEEVSMGDLVRDNKVGKKSETEKRMQENWADIKRRRKEEIERRREAGGQSRHGKQAKPIQPPAAEPVAAPVPRQIIVNGQIVVAAESREIDFGAGVEQAVIEDADGALEDDRIYKYVHQGTLGKHAGRRRGKQWDLEQTELFYKGLRMFGTDFSMIANLFPEWDRKQVKLKFIAEERANPARVQECVAAKESVDLEEYSKLANQEFEDPDKLQAELEAEERRLREEDRRRRANEGYEIDGADIALPSTEQDGDEVGNAADEVPVTGTGTVPSTQPASTRRERISALAEAVVAAAAAPRKNQTQQRKTKESAGRGRQAKKGRKPMEGVEERIGPIDEVSR
ncbi:uncharacterized protein Z518_04526 [Rhinocladiella mackenziei CBS 650.93]|uniref:Myb-like domain-containing protein n=1 Tax=Rhinocladiella mackenziei CBS 650.93 TaxID=1442369 RepID=A0A0D2JBT1_9EURO|nr:uncharacterized protein Z518_04526 [Rhinocladiella mackenziei CBS 650.93]KIX06550.1 hypothetical protein Z518_04526 [Rhinocladiella mackenziei CBS 650.93]